LTQKKAEYKSIKTKLASRSYSVPTLFVNPLDRQPRVGHETAEPSAAAGPQAPQVPLSKDEGDKPCLIM